MLARATSRAGEHLRRNCKRQKVPHQRAGAAFPPLLCNIDDHVAEGVVNYGGRAGQRSAAQGGGRFGNARPRRPRAAAGTERG